MKDRHVEVHWYDPAGVTRWLPLKDHLGSGPANCRSTGYLVKKDPKFVVLVLTQDDEEKAADSLTIPRACVKSIIYLTPRKRRKAKKARKEK